jgi:hypothetical protein
MKQYNQSLYYDLELNILSCLLQRPELMKQLKLEDKHFVKFHRLWLFMKVYYKKYGNYDLVLMTTICKDKYHIIEYLKMMVEVEPAPSRFNKYQEQLIKMFEESQKEKETIEKIFELANELYVRDIMINEFKDNIEKIIGGEANE